MEDSVGYTFFFTSCGFDLITWEVQASEGAYCARPEWRMEILQVTDLLEATFVLICLGW
jgi:hypothetical protein